MADEEREQISILKNMPLATTTTEVQDDASPSSPLGQYEMHEQEVPDDICPHPPQMGASEMPDHDNMEDSRHMLPIEKREVREPDAEEESGTSVPQEKNATSEAPVDFAGDKPDQVQPEVIEIDTEEDPPEVPPEQMLRPCNYETLSRLQVRKSVHEPESELRAGVRNVLNAMSQPPESFGGQTKAENERFLDSIKDHVRNADEFVAGTFGNASAAWEELLQESKRQSSKTVLKWIKEGVKPVFEGVANCEPAKLNKVRGLLRHSVPSGRVEELLRGVLPHEIELKNHMSVYEHWSFAVDAVEKLVITSTAYLYGRSEGKPKVVNPLGVALNADN